MRAFLALAVLVALSGCLVDSSDSSGGSRSVQCVNDKCTVCSNGQCAPCSGDACNRCLDQGKECPTAPANQTVVAAPDTHIDDRKDLTAGLPATTYSFTVAAAATSSMHVSIAGTQNQPVTPDSSACVKWTWEDGLGSESKSSAGDCGSGGVQVSVVGDGLTGVTYLDQTNLRPGSWTLTVSAPMQPNALVVQIDIDNP